MPFVFDIILFNLINTCLFYDFERQKLHMEYGTKVFEERTIRRMMKFAQIFPDIKIVTPLVSKLSWSHFLIVMTIKDELQREFYLTLAASERWSVRQLQE